MHGNLLSGFHSSVEHANLVIFEQDFVGLRRDFHDVLRQSRACGKEKKRSREQHSQQHTMRVLHDSSPVPIVREFLIATLSPRKTMRQPPHLVNITKGGAPAGVELT